MRTEKTVLENKKTSPLFISAAIAIVISTALAAGFTLMLGTTFGISFNIKRTIFASLLTAVIFSAIFLINKKWISFAALMTAPAIFGLSLYRDWFDVQKGFMALLYYLKLYVFLWLPGEYPEDPDANRTVLVFFIVYNLIAISVTAFVVMKHKWIPCALVFYVPHFLFSVTNTDISPKAAPCLVAGAGVILLLLCNAFRKKKQATYEKMLILLTVPVFCFMFALGGIYPQKKYNKDKLARNIIIETRDWFDKSFGRDNPVRRILDRALNGFENTDFDDSYDAVSPLYATSTNLNKVGPFNPSSEEVLKVNRYINPYYSGTTPYYSSTLYLKVESLDTYQNNTLSSKLKIKQPYKRNIELENESAPYGVKITPLKSASVDIVPYYTDYYHIPGVKEEQHNLYNTTHKRITDFASSNLPVKTGNIYSDEYLNNYVNKTCLDVPYSTDRALILGGNLPEWYLDVYYERTHMSDYEKVKNVTEYVRSLHPYSIDTEYPPRGVDFVPWFVNEGESGICVHYAVTSVVLLRMIGVPARYVRGYTAPNTMIDSETTVLASHAHAWFEVFVPEYGWVMGDATPGYNVDESYFNIEALAWRNRDVKTSDFVSKDNPETTTTETSDTSETTTEETTSETSEGETTAATTPSESGARPSSNMPVGTDNYTGSHSPEDLPYEKVQLPESFIRLCKAFVVLLIVLAAAAVFTMIARAVFMIFWTNRFNSEKINDKAIARYHYFMLMARVFRFIFPEEVRQIAEKATFSGKDISKKEYETMVKTCRQIMNTSSVDYSGIKKILFRLMRI